MLTIAILPLACGGDRSTEPALDVLRGQTAMDEGRAGLARLYFQEARSQRDSPELQRAEAMAWLSGHQQSLTEAIQLFTEYLESIPDDEGARTELARALVLLGRTEEAREALSSPECSTCAVHLAALLAETEPAEALALLGPQGGPDAGAQPWHADHWVVRARAAIASTDPKAHDWCRQALVENPLHVELWYLMAQEESKAHNREAASRALKIQRELRVLFADGTLGEASPQRELDGISALEELLLEDLGTTPWQLELQRVDALGRLLADSQTEPTIRAQALSDLQRAISKLRQRDTPTSVLSEIATAAGEAGLRRLANELFLLVRASNPNHPGATASLVMLALEANQLDTAEATLTDGLNSNPNFARYHLLRARLAQRQGELEQAQTALDRTLELAPWHVDWRIEYVDLLRALGDDRWQEVLAEAEGTSPRLTEYRARLGI